MDTKSKSTNAISPKPMLQVIGVKPAESSTVEYIRIITFVALIVYIVYMIYDDYTDDIAREEALAKLFKDDDAFYKKLIEMEPEVRNKYLDAVKNSLDDNKNKKTTLFNTVRTGLLAGMISEFITSGSNAKVMGTITKTLLYSSISAMS